MTYDDFRTGLTFGEVRRMLWVDNPDPTTWKHKSRGVVLGLWHRLKLDLWDEYLGQYEAAKAQARARLVPVRKLIKHRGRQFEVTYWKLPQAAAA